MHAPVGELQALFSDLQGYHLSAEEHARLLKRAKETGDEQAKDAFLAANMALVVSIAVRYEGRGVSLQDLVQEGAIGLLRAFHKFDPARGHAFSTYATWWVRQAVSRACMEASLIHAPGYVQDGLRAARAYQNAREVAGEETPTEAELAEASGLSLPFYRAGVRASAVLSLDVPLAENEESSLAETLISPQDAAEEAEAQVGKDWQRGRILHALELLTSRQRTVLILRYGLSDGCARTLDEVSAALGISRERARQLEVGALSRLRSAEGRRRLAGEAAPLAAPSVYARAMHEQEKEWVS